MSGLSPNGVARIFSYLLCHGNKEKIAFFRNRTHVSTAELHLTGTFRTLYRLSYRASALEPGACGSLIRVLLVFHPAPVASCQQYGSYIWQHTFPELKVSRFALKIHHTYISGQLHLLQLMEPYSDL